MPKVLRKFSKISEISYKPKKWLKYLETLKLPKYPLNLKNDRDILENYKMTKIFPETYKMKKMPLKHIRWLKYTLNLIILKPKKKKMTKWLWNLENYRNTPQNLENNRNTPEI